VIQKKAQAILNALDCPDGELSIVIVDDVRIAELNQTYLQHTGPTNVISFPMREGDFSQINPDVLGDVVISADTCAREAEGAGISTQDRLDQLLIHGILHLLGYDHVHSESESRVMEAKSNELLALLETLNVDP
jgi:probable rRNA maturation factor